MWLIHTVFENKQLNKNILEILLSEISFGTSRQNDFNCTCILTDLLDLYCNIDMFSDTSIQKKHEIHYNAQLENIFYVFRLFNIPPLKNYTGIYKIFEVLYI